MKRQLVQPTLTFGAKPALTGTASVAVAAASTPPSTKAEHAHAAAPAAAGAGTLTSTSAIAHAKRPRLAEADDACSDDDSVCIVDDGGSDHDAGSGSAGLPSLLKPSQPAAAAHSSRVSLTSHSNKSEARQPAPTAAAGPSALDRLMAKSKEPRRQEVFCLRWATGGGQPPRWCWDWSVPHSRQSQSTTSSASAESGATAATAGAPSSTSSSSAATTCDCPWRVAIDVKVAGSKPDTKPTRLTLCTNVNPTAATAASSAPASAASSSAPPAPAGGRQGPDPSIRLSPSMLKSCLQKAIRRGLSEAAARITAEMWCRDAQDLVRRLMIIAIEDAILHPALPLLAWLMMAQAAGYAPSQVHGGAVVKIAREIAAQNAWKDRLDYPADDDGVEADDDDGSAPAAAASAPSASISPSSSAVPSAAAKPRPPLSSLLPSPADIDQLPCPQGALVRSLVCRQRHGGMKGDVAMLTHAARTWMGRFAAVDAITHSATASADGAGHDARVECRHDNESSKHHQQQKPLSRSRIGGFHVPPELHADSWLAALERLHGLPMSSACASNANGSSSGSSSISGSGDSSSAANRHQHHYYCYPGPFPPPSAIHRLTLQDIPLAGVDWHCSDILVEVLANRDGEPKVAEALAKMRRMLRPTDDEQFDGMLKSAVWNYRSGVNVRNKLPKPDAAASSAAGASSSSSSCSKQAISSAVPPVQLARPGPVRIPTWEQLGDPRYHDSSGGGADDDDASNQQYARVMSLLGPLLDQWAGRYMGSRISSH